MAVTVIVPTVLAINTASASLTDAAGGQVATTPAHGWDLAASAYHADHILLKFFADAAGETAVVITAGDNPPAIRAGGGDLTITLTADLVKYIVVETSRFMQNDGTIHAYCTDAGTRMSAFILPVGA